VKIEEKELSSNEMMRIAIEEQLAENRKRAATVKKSRIESEAKESNRDFPSQATIPIAKNVTLDTSNKKIS